MVLALRRPIEFNRDGYSGCQPGCHAEDQAQPETITESKQNRIRYGSRQQTQRTMRAAQQVVRQVEAAEHIQATARDADGSNRVVVHP